MTIQGNHDLNTWISYKIFAFSETISQMLATQGIYHGSLRVFSEGLLSSNLFAVVLLSTFYGVLVLSAKEFLVYLQYIQKCLQMPSAMLGKNDVQVYRVWRVQWARFIWVQWTLKVLLWTPNLILFFTLEKTLFS